MYVIVAPFGQSFDERGFIYSVSEELSHQVQPGIIVKIPFGEKEVFGCVLEVLSRCDINVEKIKSILSLYSQTPFLYPLQISLMRWISEYYFCLIHQSTSLFFPKNLVQKIQKGTFFFSELKKLSYNFSYQKSLTPHQKEVFLNIIQSPHKHNMLHGVTGSGKTEVYIELMKHYLEVGKQIVLLVPEIILTQQIFERIQKVFGKEVLILNSTVSEAKKTLYWQQIYHGSAKVIVGTRSALFYPYKDLGLIIIDEEHDNSYISDNAPRYDAIEVALKISDVTDCKVLLSSATPKINHYYKFLQEKYPIFYLLGEYTSKIE